MASWKDVLKIVSGNAPSIAAALGGPLAGTAMAAIESVFGLSGSGSTDQRQQAITTAVEGATPDQLAQIRAKDQEYALAMQKAGFDNVQALEALAAQDRADARSTAVKTGSLTPTILAYLVVGMTIFGEGFLLIYGAPKTVDGVIVGRVLGTLDTALILVLQFYYGSTAGSQHANELLAASTPVGQPATGGQFKS